MKKTQNKQYKYFLFDWDNCLAKTGKNWRKAFATILEDNGLILDENQRNEALTKLIREDLHPIKPGENTKKIWENITDLVAIYNRTVKLHKNVKDVLHSLKQKDRNIALVSTSLRSAIDAGLSANNLESLFDIVVSANDVKNFKPNPESLNKALTFFGANLEKSIKIGDRDTDVYAAKNAGIDSALYFPKDHHKWYNFEEFKKSNPEYIIKNHIELLRLFSD